MEFGAIKISYFSQDVQNIIKQNGLDADGSGSIDLVEQQEVLKACKATKINDLLNEKSSIFEATSSNTKNVTIPFSDSYNVDSEEIKALKLTSGQLKELDKLDGNEDGQIERSYVEVAQAYKTSGFLGKNVAKFWNEKLNNQFDKIKSILTQDREYNDKGQEIRYTEDKNGDGTIDCVQTWEYNEQGEKIRYTEDENDDGTIDYVSTFEYNEQGAPIRCMYDQNGDGTIDYVKTIEYNEQGQEIRYTEDKNGDGKIDYVETHEYNDEGQEIRYTVDKNGDGKNDYVATYEYNDKGEIIRCAEDQDGDGAIDLVYEGVFVVE